MDRPLGPALTAPFDACLVVEDDPIIRMDLEETLRGFGFTCVLGTATVEAAEQIVAEGGLSFAVLDYEVGRSNTSAIAELLVVRGVPVVFLSAYGAGLELPAAVAHLEVIPKPFSSDLLMGAMRKALVAGMRMERISRARALG